MAVYDHLVRLVAANPAYLAFTRESLDQLVGRTPDDRRYSFADGGERLVELVAGTADSCQTELEIHRADGTSAAATVTGHAVRHDGELTHIGLRLTETTGIETDLSTRLSVATAIREAASTLDSGDHSRFESIVVDLFAVVAEAHGVDTIVAAWADGSGAAKIVASGPSPSGGRRTALVAGLDVRKVLDLSTSSTIGTDAVPGLDEWGSQSLDIKRFRHDEDAVGWLASSGNRTCWPTSAQKPLLAFLAQATQRVAQTVRDQRRTRLQAFVNQTASDYLAHRFTGDRQEVLDTTLAGLAANLQADNAQFRIVDWDRMVSETTAEFVAHGHSETNSEFRTLDLNEPLYRDIASATEPIAFEIDGMRGQRVSVVNVPLVVEGLTTATINVAAPCGRQWDELDMDACRSVAGLMVQLQRRIELEQALAQRLALSDAVNRIATDFNDASPETAAAVIADALATTAQTLGVPRIALWRHSHREQTAVLDMMWEEGVGATSLAGIGSIHVPEHPSTKALFESVTPVALGPADIPTDFGEVPEDLHLLYVPVGRGGHVRLGLSIESWQPRVWTDAEIEEAQSIARLISQLSARVDAETAMVKRLAVEDITRKIATAMLHHTNQTAVAGIRDALGAIGEGLDLDRAALWQIDRRTGRIGLLARWSTERLIDARADSPAEMPMDAVLGRLADSDEPLMEVSSAECGAIEGAASSIGLVAPLAHAGQRPTGLLVFERHDGLPWTGEDHRAIEVVGTLIVQLGARLEAENYFTTAFENAPVGITLRDDDGRLLACNRAFEEFVGRTQAELLGTTVDDALRPEYTDAHGVEREFRLERPDGTQRWGRVTEAEVSAASSRERGALWLRHITDITATRQAMEQLEYQAGHDELTGLANRRVLMDQLRLCLQPIPQSTDAAILLLDIDRFKVINDSLGHSTGDEVLRVVADRLRLAVRPQDVVCRLGGDEFVVLLRGPVSGIESSAVASRLLELLSDPIELGTTRMFLSASIGIANPTEADDALEDVLRHADAAMYRAKARGRNRFEVFNQSHRAALARRVEVESELRRAIADEALELHYQPELELRSGRLLGAEALVRWAHPRLGLLSAGSFIDVAEETGQVVELGRLVLDMACRQAAIWNQGRARPLTVRVNLSAHQLDRPELVSEVQTALATHRVQPEHLCLEITETAIMSDVDESLRLLQRLREVGVRLAIDDFGTGFSSLAYLKRLPVDILKIDQTFVRGLGRDRDDEAIVRSVLSMAEALDLVVVAEGIESPEQRIMLLEMGCTRGQGYGLTRPLPAEELSDLFAAGGINVQQMLTVR